MFLVPDTELLNPWNFLVMWVIETSIVHNKPLLTIPEFITNEVMFKQVRDGRTGHQRYHVISGLKGSAPPSELQGGKRGWRSS